MKFLPVRRPSASMEDLKEIFLDVKHIFQILFQNTLSSSWQKAIASRDQIAVTES